MGRYGILVIAVVISSLSPSQAHARQLGVCVKNWIAIEKILHDSSVELEMDLSPELLRIFTTNDGTLRPLLRNVSVPDWLEKQIMPRHPKLKSAEEIPWDRLQPDEKLKLLRSVSFQRSHTQSYVTDKIVHGLVPRKEVILDFQEPKEFLGKTYPAGKHRIQLSEFLIPHVEYKSPKELRNFRGVEIHFRVRTSAGDAAKNAWTFQDLVGVPKTAQHVHMVAPLPRNELAKDHRISPALYTDFYARTNLLSEIISFHSGIFAQDKLLNGSTFFSSLDPSALRQVNLYFTEVAQGLNPRLKDNLKWGFVGLHGSDKYDSPDLWGLQWRRINPNDDPEALKGVLDAIQKKMNSGFTPEEHRRMEAWADSITDSPYLTAPLVDGWYQQPLSDLIRDMPSELRQEWNPVAKRFFEKNDENARQIKMALFDWSKTPLFFGRPKILEQIRSQQARALRRISTLGPDATNSDILDVFQDFMWDSGLASTVAESLGVDLKLLKKDRLGVVGI